MIFKTRSDYVAGMNAIPVYILNYDVAVLAFCLMSNHVHFVVRGQENSCVKFIRHYRKRLAVIAGTAREDVRMAGICMKRITDADYLMRVIGYVLRNPVNAGQKVMPSHYEWCSASLYFRGHHQALPVGQTVNSLNYRERRRLLGSHAVDVPEYYTLSPEGMIYPECYVDIEAVERLFQNPGRLLYRLSRNDDAELELDMTSAILRQVHYRDEELAGSVLGICREEFRCASVRDLTIEQRYILAGILRKRYGTGFKQMARLTGTDPVVLKKVLNLRK